MLSTETLHAFVDAELDAVEQQRVARAMACDPGVVAQVREIREIRYWLRAAYPSPDRGHGHEADCRRPLCRLCRLLLGHGQSRPSPDQGTAAA